MGSPGFDLDPTPLIERNAPNFTDPRKHAEWKLGKATRDEVIGDFVRLNNANAYLQSVLQAVKTEVEILRRMLVERGLLDREAYQKYVATHASFMMMLDSLNFGPGADAPWQVKIDTCVKWNEEHPEMRVMGDYLKGLREHLKLSEANGGLPLVKRFEAAGDMGIPEEDVLSPEEIEQVEKELRSEMSEEERATFDKLMAEKEAQHAAAQREADGDTTDSEGEPDDSENSDTGRESN